MDSRRLYLTLALLLGVVAPLQAQLFSPPGAKIRAGVVSRHIWRGLDILPDNRPAFQGEVHYVFGTSGFEARAFVSTAISNRDMLKAQNLPRDLDEVDLSVKMYRSLTRALGMTVGLNNYFFPRKSGLDNAYSPEAFVGFTLQDIPLFPTLTLYYDFNLGDDLYAQLSFNQFVPFGERLYSLQILVGYNNGQYGVDSGFSDVEIGLSTDLRFQGFAFTPSFHWVITPGQRVNRNNEVWVGAMLSRAFP